MEEVRRVPTTKEKKKSTTLLIILASVLGIGLIALAVYFYTLEEDPGKAEETSQTTCACYYIDPAVTPECGDPRRGFLFELQTVPSNQQCSAPCSVDKLTTNLLNSSTKQELYLTCPLQVVQDSRCNEMTIKDSAGKIVTGKVSSDDEITIEAKFDNKYTDHKFIINNQEIEPEIISPDSLTISKTYSDLDTSTLNIFATAVDSTANQINSPICRRLIEIDQEGVSDLSGMQVQTRKDESDVYKISRIKIGIGNISEEKDLIIKFTFNKEGLNDLSMSEGWTVDSAKGEITILEQDLYNSGNFSSDQNFSQLDGEEGSIQITAEIRTESEVIGTVDTTFNFPTTKSSEHPVEAVESRFSVTKTSNVKCVERVSPNNSAQFTLTTKNQGTTAQDVLSVKDKLPLGFKYVPKSSKINGTTVDDEYVKITDVGDSQEIVWEKKGGWSINTGDSLTIVFMSKVEENALTGENQNEVVITPAEIPTDPATLRAELVIEVAQSCGTPSKPPKEDKEETPKVEVEEPESDTTPETGIFDSVISRILLGILVVTVGWYIYSKPMGQTIVEKLVSSGVFKEAEFLSWRIFKPKKYFESKIIRKLSKKRNIKDSQ